MSLTCEKNEFELTGMRRLFAEETLIGYSRDERIALRDGTSMTCDALRVERGLAKWIQCCDGREPENLSCLLGEVDSRCGLGSALEEALAPKGGIEVNCLAVVFLDNTSTTKEALRVIQRRLSGHVAFRVYTCGETTFKITCEGELTCEG